MNKLFATIAITSLISCSTSASIGVEIKNPRYPDERTILLDYNASYADAVMKIVFEDPLQFFADSYVVKSGGMPFECYMVEARKILRDILDNPHCIKKILVKNEGAHEKVIGFLAFNKAREQTIESLKRIAASQGIIVTDNQILMHMPSLKRTDAECEPFMQIEGIAISREFRGKGYGKILLQYAVDTMKTLFPSFEYVYLNVNAENEIARTLCFSEGFKISPVQPVFAEMIRAVQYRKKLR